MRTSLPTGRTPSIGDFIRVPPDLITLDTHWMDVAVLDSAALGAPDFTPAIAGYAADKPPATMWGDSKPGFTTVEPSRLTYAVDTAPGESGAAVWSLNPTKPYFGQVVGIHVLSAGSGDANIASRIDSGLLADLLEGCRVMQCTIAYAASAAPLPAGERPFRATGVGLARD